MKRLILLRAYGDFIVALQSLLYSRQMEAYQLVASLHHLPLFEALPACLIPPNFPIRFVDFGIKGPMLRALTNRHIVHADTLKELAKVSLFCKENPNSYGTDFIENNHRKWLVELGTGTNFSAIAGDRDIYKTYHYFFNTEMPINQGFTSIDDASVQTKKILILPSARIAKRDIPEALVQKIKENHLAKNQEVTIASYKISKSKSIVYSKFSELIQLIDDSDYIYGADSLPIHLSYFMQKPHTIVYPAGGSHQFFTPYALENKAYFTFNQFS